MTATGERPPRNAGERASEPRVEDALARAGRHARNAAAESLAALRALLDAAAILSGGAPAESHAALARAARWLDELIAQLAASPGDATVTRALAEALDAEIARWEERARDDPDARAVLRAFLGVRELLWELGVRPTPKGAEPPGAAAPRRRKRRRVERVPVQG